MSRRHLMNPRAHRTGSLAGVLTQSVGIGTTAEHVHYRLLRFQSLEDRLALSAGAETSSAAAPPVNPDLVPVFAAAFVGTPVTISLPVQLTAGQYQFIQGPQHGTATVNNQGQLVYTAADAGDLDDIEILTGAVDTSGNPVGVDVQIQTVSALPASTPPIGWSTQTTLESNGTYQAQISSLYQDVVSSVVDMQFLPAAASSYAAQISTDSLASGPQNGTLVEVAPLDWVYTPNAGFTGVDQVTLNVHAADPNATRGNQNTQFFDGQVVIFINVDTANAGPGNPPAASTTAAASTAAANATVPAVEVPNTAVAAVDGPVAVAPVAVAPVAAVANPASLVEQGSQSTPIVAATPAAPVLPQATAPVSASVASVPVAAPSTAAVDAVFAVASGSSQDVSPQLASPAQPASALDPVNNELLWVL